MTRQSKQGERRARSPRRCRAPAAKTGPKKDNLANGFREHGNALEGTLATQLFIPKIR
jgi:hypothetical protein